MIRTHSWALNHFGYGQGVERTMMEEIALGTKWMKMSYILQIFATKYSQNLVGIFPLQSIGLEAFKDLKLEFSKSP